MKWMIMFLLAVFSVASTACELDLNLGDVPTVDDGYTFVDDDTTATDDDANDDADDETPADDADDTDDDIDDDVDDDILDDDANDDDTTLTDDDTASDDDTSDDDTVFNDDDVDDDIDDDTTPVDDDADDDTEPCVNVDISPTAPTGNIELGRVAVQIIEVSVPEDIYSAAIKGFWFEVEIEPAQDMTGHFDRPQLWVHNFTEQGMGEFDPATGMISIYNPNGMMHIVTAAEGFETFELWLDVIDLQPGDQFRVNFIDLEAYTWPYDYNNPLNSCLPEAGEWLTVS